MAPLPVGQKGDIPSCQRHYIMPSVNQHLDTANVNSIAIAIAKDGHPTVNLVLYSTTFEASGCKLCNII